mmetsp:Transcript_22528/g.39826  ORF Transcript_22528/g.39826 Transcript_22528/m.39826 type:complete len:214 (-) Transcript_22528:1078-1719(-)
MRRARRADEFAAVPAVVSARDEIEPFAAQLAFGARMVFSPDWSHVGVEIVFLIDPFQACLLRGHIYRRLDGNNPFLLILFRLRLHHKGFLWCFDREEKLHFLVLFRMEGHVSHHTGAVEKCPEVQLVARSAHFPHDQTLGVQNHIIEQVEVVFLDLGAFSRVPSERPLFLQLPVSRISLEQIHAIGIVPVALQRMKLLLVLRLANRLVDLGGY